MVGAAAAGVHAEPRPTRAVFQAEAGLYTERPQAVCHVLRAACDTRFLCFRVSI